MERNFCKQKQQAYIDKMNAASSYENTKRAQKSRDLHDHVIIIMSFIHIYFI